MKTGQELLPGRERIGASLKLTIRQVIDLMARETGLEPATSGVTGRRSNQLSYSPAGAVRARGLRIGQRLNEVKQFPFIQYDPSRRPNVDFDRLRPTRKKQIDLTFAEGALFFPHASG